MRYSNIALYTVLAGTTFVAHGNANLPYNPQQSRVYRYDTQAQPQQYQQQQQQQQQHGYYGYQPQPQAQTQDPLHSQNDLEVEDALAEGWIELTDPNSGRAYYYHAGMQRTQWEKPVAEHPSVPQVEELQEQQQDHNQLAMEEDMQHTQQIDDVDGEVEGSSIVDDSMEEQTSNTAMENDESSVEVEPVEQTQSKFFSEEENQKSVESQPQQGVQDYRMPMYGMNPSQNQGQMPSGQSGTSTQQTSPQQHQQSGAWGIPSNPNLHNPQGYGGGKMMQNSTDVGQLQSPLQGQAQQQDPRHLPLQQQQQQQSPLYQSQQKPPQQQNYGPPLQQNHGPPPQHQGQGQPPQAYKQAPKQAQEQVYRGAPPQQQQGQPNQQLPPQQQGPPQKYPPVQQQQQQRPPSMSHHQQQHQYGYSSPNPYNQYQQQQPHQQGYYNSYSGNYYNQPGGGAMIQQQEGPNVVREGLLNAWQGVLGFGSRTKETLQNAASSVAAGATAAGQTIGTTTTDLVGKAKTSINQVFEGQGQQGGQQQGSYSLSQYGAPPIPQQGGQWYPQQGYPPQQRGGYPQPGSQQMYGSSVGQGQNPSQIASYQQQQPQPRNVPAYPHQPQHGGRPGGPSAQQQTQWGEASSQQQQRSQQWPPQQQQQQPRGQQWPPQQQQQQQSQQQYPPHEHPGWNN